MMKQTMEVIGNAELDSISGGVSTLDTIATSGASVTLDIASIETGTDAVAVGASVY